MMVGMAQLVVVVAQLHGVGNGGGAAAWRLVKRCSCMVDGASDDGNAAGGGEGPGGGAGTAAWR